MQISIGLDNNKWERRKMLVSLDTFHRKINYSFQLICFLFCDFLNNHLKEFSINIKSVM
jgi:hypothetical protein